jgi:hypothetical protein
MDVHKYKVSTASTDGFKSAFKKMMNIEVKSIVVVDNLMHHVEPAGDLPVGFVILDRSEWCLVGWTDRKKRTSCQNLNPWKKQPVLLYGPWVERKWQIRELYKCVFSRIRLLTDFPDIVRSISNWEDGRQALYTCVTMLDKTHTKRLLRRETELMSHVMSDNPELLHTTCQNLGLKTDVEELKRHLESMYATGLNVNNKNGYRQSGLLETIEGHISAKWRIKEQKL